MDKELFFPFDGERQADGSYDRDFDAADFAEFHAGFLGDGVHPQPSTALKVTSSYGNMIVRLDAGRGYIKGRYYRLDEGTDVAVNKAHASQKRLDHIVLELNHIGRKMEVRYIQGTPAASPVVPSLVRNDDVWQLRLAQITVNAGATAISNADILDTRLDDKVCGIVHGAVDQVSTADIFNQYQTYLNTQISGWDKTKQQQQQAFETQLASQQARQDEFIRDGSAWFTTVQQDLPKYASFDFGNASAYPGSKIETVKSGDTVTATMKNSASGKTIATSVTTKGSNSIVTVETVYRDDGVTILRKSTATTTTNGGTVTTTVV